MNKFFIVSMSSILIATLCSCTKSPNIKLYHDGDKFMITKKSEFTEPYTLSYDIMAKDDEDPSDVMPIGGFYGLYASGGSIDGHEIPNLLSEYYFKKIAEAGINMITYTVDKWTTGGTNSNLHTALDYAEKYNMGYFVECYEVAGQLGTHTTDFPLEDMTLNTKDGEKILDNLINEITKNGQRKSLLGIHGFDEPFTKQLDNLGVLTNKFYSLCQKKNYNYDIYMNLNGYWANENNFWGYSDSLEYDEYLKLAFEQVKPRMLSVTQYPYVQPNTKEETITALMYDRLSKYRDYANHYKVPFWRMLQAGGQWNDNQEWIPSTDPYPTEGELLFDVNMALTYGAKAIQYFPLVEPFYFSYKEGYTYDFTDRNGLIGADGNLTRWYFYAKRANEQIKAIDHILMHSNNEQIIVHGNNAISNIIDKGQPGNDIYKDGGYKQLTSIKGDDCVVGCFNYKGATALYVTNYNRQNKANVSLKFDKKNYLYEVIQRANSIKVIGEEIPLTLDPGEGALIVLE